MKIQWKVFIEQVKIIVSTRNLGSSFPGLFFKLRQFSKYWNVMEGESFNTSLRDAAGWRPQKPRGGMLSRPGGNFGARGFVPRGFVPTERGFRGQRMMRGGIPGRANRGSNSRVNPRGRVGGLARGQMSRGNRGRARADGTARGGRQGT